MRYYFLTPYKTNSDKGNWVVYVEPMDGQKSVFYFWKKADAFQWIKWFNEN